MNLDSDKVGFENSKAFKLEDSITYAEGAIVSKIISKKETGNVTLFSFDKDQFLSEHTAPFDAIIQSGMIGIDSTCKNAAGHKIAENMNAILSRGAKVVFALDGGGRTLYRIITYTERIV